MPRPDRAPAWRSIGLVLAGAVTRGAFEAGALKVLAERGVPVRRIVAASSGALNGTVYASAIHARREARATQELLDLWRDRGGVCDVIHPSLRDIVRGRGISDSTKILALLRRAVRPTRSPDPAPVDLHIVVAALDGVMGRIGSEPATTYTAKLDFSGSHFESEEQLEEVFTAAVASSAFPGLYAPVDVPGIGPCVDGGIETSTPLRFACDDADGVPVDACVIIVPTPILNPRSTRSYGGRRLLAHVTDMLFDERLYQDLRAMAAGNEARRRLEALAEVRRWSPEEMHLAEGALGWAARPIIPVVPIRPIAPLPGDAFSGFFDRRARERYIEAGVERANRTLDELGWT